MKKLLFLLLFLPALVYSQQKPIAFWNQGFSANAQQYFARYDTKPTGDTLKWYAEFIDSLTLNGVWAQIDEMWIYANNTQANSLLGVKGYKNSAAVNTPTFTSYRGFAGNGSTSYINTNYNPSSDKVSLTANSMSIGAYSRTNTQSNKAIMGNLGASPNRYMYIYPWTNTGFFLYPMNQTSDNSVASTTSLGFYAANRSDASSIQAYRNGTQAGTASVAASTINNVALYVCAINQNGTAAEFSTRQIAFAYVGASLTAQQQLNLYNCLQRLMTKIGANV